MKTLKIVQVIPDDRDMRGLYGLEFPIFGPAPAALLSGFESLGDQIEVHVISCSRQTSSTPEKLAPNIFYHQVNVNAGYRKSLFLEAVFKIRKKIREIDPDIVHGQGTEEYCGLAAAFSGYPNCITIHGNMRAVAKKKKYKPFFIMGLAMISEALSLCKTQRVFCNSTYTEQCVGLLNKHRLRVFNAVRLNFFEKEWAPANSNTFVCVGHIIAYKNQIGLIKALDQLAEKYDFSVKFAGRCSSDDAYGQQFLKAVGARKWCEYVGCLDESALEELLSSCSGLIHPTLEDSFGLAVAEAQALGVPVAASAIGGIPDLIEHGETGLLFNPHDAQDICLKVASLLDAEVSGRLSKNEKAYSRKVYAPAHIAHQHVQAYESLSSN